MCLIEYESPSPEHFFLLVNSSWWLPITAAPVAAQACLIPVYSYWISYAKAKNTISGDLPATTGFVYSQIRACTVFLMATALAACVVSAPSNPSRVFSAGCSETTSVVILALTFVLLNSTLALGNAPRSVLSIELTNFIIFCALASFLLLTSSNLLIAFFALELLGSTALYAFFVFGGYSASGGAQQSAGAVTSCVYQFILNFFGSIVFYTSLSALAYYHASNTLYGAPARMAAGPAAAAQAAAVGALFIKMGTGPWVFYKLSIYKGITVQTVAAYTFVYFGAVLVFTTGVVLRSAAELTPGLGAACVLVFAASAAMFGGSAFQTGTTTLFLSFSSMLNLIFLALQIV